jgi:hypothetical protein
MLLPVSGLKKDWGKKRLFNGLLAENDFAYFWVSGSDKIIIRLVADLPIDGLVVSDDIFILNDFLKVLYNRVIRCQQ